MGIDADQDETLFAMSVRIFHRTGDVVVENLDRIGEVDPVFAQFGLALALIPFEIDVHGKQCMYNFQPLPLVFTPSSVRKAT